MSSKSIAVAIFAAALIALAAAPAGAQQAASAATGKVIKTGNVSPYGEILQDSRGRTLYLFTKERSHYSKCYGECAKEWPPVITRGAPRARDGAKASKLGTTRRRGGKVQVTYNGHPLYYYVDETRANQVLCQAVYEFGGLWYVVNKNGNAVKRR